MFDYVLGHCSFVGQTGYASHCQNFFTELNKLIPVRIRNYAHYPTLDHLTKEQQDMVIHMKWSEPPWEIGTPFERKPTDKVLNIILLESNHFWYYQKYDGPVIAYNVWESTRQPDDFFKRCLQFDEFWTPTTWQANCTIEQGYPIDRVKVIPEGVDGSTFFPHPKDTPLRSDDIFRFMILGRWDYRKYTTEQIRAFTETFDPNEPVQLILSVDNPFPVDNMKTTEERMAHWEFDDPRIIIKHFMPRQEYIDLVKNGQVLLNVSRSEGWGLPIIEAIASGTPALVSDWGAHLDFCRQGQFYVKTKELKPPMNVFMQNTTPGLWAEPDYNDLKSKMRYVYENYDELKKLVISESVHVRSKFTWENAARIAFDEINKMDVGKYYPVKLNLGSGAFLKDGYVNVDLYYDKADLKANISKLPYDDETVTEIYSSHSLEHFNKYEVPNVLKEWNRVLKLDGILNLEVPDFEWCTKKWLEDNNKIGFSLDRLFGNFDHTGEQHKIGFTQDTIKAYLLEAGFSNIEMKTIWSHEQQCIEIQAIKRKLEFNDDIFVIDCYPNTDEKKEILKNQIDKIRKVCNKPIAIVSHIPIPESIMELADYFILDKDNRSTEFRLSYWYSMPKHIKVISHFDRPYHGLSCLSSMKNAATFLKDKFRYMHFIESDTNIDFELYLEYSNGQRILDKKFIGFKYYNDVEKHHGIITNIFSTDIQWFDKTVEEFPTWDSFVNRTKEMDKAIQCTDDKILENWLWNYFRYKDVIKDTYFIENTNDFYNKVVSTLNKIDQHNGEDSILVRVSETNDHKIVLFLLKDDFLKGSSTYKIVYDKKEIDTGTINCNEIKYYKFEKQGKIQVWYDTFYKEFDIDPNMEYVDHMFRFYDDRIKCLKWESKWDEGFMETDTGDTVLFTFENTAKIEIVGPSNIEYKAKFIDCETGFTKYETTLKPYHWASASPRYYVDWKLEVYNGDNLYKEHKFDLKGKIVKIAIDSKAMGDTIAWMPYAEEFRKKYDCQVYMSTFHNYLFDKVYPEIHWIPPDSSVSNMYAFYNVGCRDNDYDSNKNNWRLIPLQQTGSDYLGLDYKPIRTKVFIPEGERPIKGKYVTMTEHSTFLCKYWLHPQGWQNVINFLKSKGIITVVISKENTNLQNVVKMINKPIAETMNTINHSEFFMGVSTGPTWLAWAMGKPTVMISGYSEEWHEMQDVIRIGSPEGKCRGCFNNLNYPFDRGNWNWCPTNKKMECTRLLSPNTVIERIKSLI